MANYFKYFPTTYYYKDYESTNLDVLTNIISRFSFEKSFKENTVVFYEYSVQDGETPEIVANKFYGSSERHWIILNLNDIIDPQYDWPLNERTLIQYVEDKYSSASYANTANTGVSGMTWAQSNNAKYFKIETRTEQISGEFIQERIEIDASTYANVSETTSSVTLGDGNIITVAITKEPQTYYQYEVELNDDKRLIKILKPEFVNAAEQEVKRVLKL